MAGEDRNKIFRSALREWNKTEKGGGKTSFRLFQVLRRLIERGTFLPGEKLPSVRRLSDFFSISKNTTETVLYALEKEGLVRIEERIGAFVAQGTKSRKEPILNSFLKKDAFLIAPIQKHKRWNSTGLLENAVNLSKRMNERWDGACGFDFVSRYFTKISENHRKGLYKGLYDEQGLPVLREFLSEWLSRFGIKAKASEILIVSRRMYMYRLLSDAFLSPEIFAGYSEISFLNSYRVGISRTAKKMLLKSDNEGLLIEPFLQCQGRKILYIQPTHNEPTGIMTSQARRERIYSECLRERIPIIEDGIMDPFYNGDKHVRPIKSLDQEGAVIYLGGIHGPVTPATSLDWIVAPERAIQALLATVRSEMQFPSEFNQMVLTELLRNGEFDEFLDKERDVIDSQIPSFFRILETHLADVASWEKEQVWGRIWINFQEPVKVSRLYRERKTVDFHPGIMYGDKTDSSVLLYLFCGQEAFEQGVRELRKLVNKVYGI